MARGKKKESALTPEEKLAQALVPDWEKPYHVPKNWIWSYIRSGYEVTSSKRVHKDDWLSEGVPFYRTRELVKLSEHGYVDNELFISEEQYEEYKTAYGVPRIGDLLISGVGTIGVPYIVDSKEKFYFKDGNVIWFKNRGLFLPKYTYFIYKSLFVDNQIHEMSSGTTVDTYTIINANNTMVPVPPIAEQQRIVDRIEYLFSKLDEAKERAQSVLDGFETRKAAILHEAFTGELTVKWRAENSVSTNWDHVLLGMVVKPVKEKYDPSDGGCKDMPYIGLEHIQKGIGIMGCGSAAAVKSLKGVFQAGDILYGKLRPYLDKHGIAAFDGVCSTDILIYRAQTECMAKYINYLFSTKAFIEYAVENSKGINLPRTSEAAISAYEFSVPTEIEQIEIVRILDSLFAKEQQAKEAAEAVLEQIDLLKKSILARAFRGELGTNDPNEESAVELLKSILGQPDEPKTTVKRTFIPKDLDDRMKTDLERKIIKLYIQQDVVSMSIDRLMPVSSKKFDVMEALRNLQQRGILVKENDMYKLLR